MTDRIKSCHGCCHEAAETCRKEHKHIPSGELACVKCFRNCFEYKDNYMTMDELKIRIKKDDDRRRLRVREQVRFT
jgi:hypothetical protein